MLTRSIPFELKLDSDYEIELEDGDYIRTRNIDEYNEVTQKTFKESISKYKNEGITKITAIGRIKKSIRASFLLSPLFNHLDRDIDQIDKKACS